MKNPVILLLVSIMILALSCKKNDDNTSTPNNSVPVPAASSQWEALSNGLPPGAIIYSICSKGTVLYVGSSNGLFFSNDKGNTWSFNSANPISTSYGLRVFNNYMFAIATSNQIFKSTNSGGTWVPIVTGLSTINSTGYVLYSDGTILWAVSYGSGRNNIYSSSNWGSAWNLLTPEFPSNGIPSDAAFSGAFCIQDVAGTKTLYAGTSNNPAQIYSSVNNGSSWSPENGGTALGPVVASLVSCNNYVFASLPSGVFKRSQNGTWNSVSSLYGNLSTDNSNLYLNTLGNNIYYSNNLGATWVDLTENIAGFTGNVFTYDNYLFTVTPGGGLYRRTKP